MVEPTPAEEAVPEKVTHSVWVVKAVVLLDCARGKQQGPCPPCGRVRPSGVRLDA